MQAITRELLQCYFFLYMNGSFNLQKSLNFYEKVAFE